MNDIPTPHDEAEKAELEKLVALYERTMLRLCDLVDWQAERWGEDVKRAEAELPSWVWDLVIAVQKHSDEHPKYHAQYYPDYEMRPAATCGCEPLQVIPDGIKADAYRLHAERIRAARGVS